MTSQSVLLVHAVDQDDLRREDAPSEVEFLCKEIHSLASKTIPESSYSYSMELKPNRNNVSARLMSFLGGKSQRTQRFTLPGRYTFKVKKSAGTGYLVQFKAKEHWNLGLYDEATANSLRDKLIKAILSAGIDLPVIVYSSANYATRNRREVLEAGGYEVTASPIDLFELIDKVIDASK